ncbi:MAG: hypothetical protein ACOC2H_07650 [Spirochaetota bacterium]
MTSETVSARTRLDIEGALAYAGFLILLSVIGIIFQLLGRVELKSILVSLTMLGISGLTAFGKMREKCLKSRTRPYSIDLHSLSAGG